MQLFDGRQTFANARLVLSLHSTKMHSANNWLSAKVCCLYYAICSFMRSCGKKTGSTMIGWSYGCCWASEVGVWWCFRWWSGSEPLRLTESIVSEAFVFVIFAFVVVILPFAHRSLGASQPARGARCASGSERTFRVLFVVTCYCLLRWPTPRFNPWNCLILVLFVCSMRLC